jgi:hypothetical protein
VWQVDAEPTAAQNEALAGIERDSASALQRWDDFKKTELPALNRALKQSQAPEIDLHSDPDQHEAELDEE